MSDDAPTLRVREIRLHERDVTLRLPFRYGVVTLTRVTEAFVRARVELGSSSAWGVAAELMAPKWFDKNPSLGETDNVDQLRRALAIARAAYAEAGAATAFALSTACTREVRERGAREGLNALTAGFGPALVDRAVLDGACRALEVSFFDAMRGNLPAFAPARLDPEMRGFDAGRFLAALAPARRIQARHTVGLVDPLTAVEVPPGAPDDGLPVALEQVLREYGQHWFKLKLGGDPDADVDRLGRIAAVLDRRGAGYGVTLDGNEQYPSVEALDALWRGIESAPGLARLRAAVAFVEQPLAREVALDVDVARAGVGAPLLIDESDDAPDAFVRARAAGYHGVSSKSCKGLYKSLLNLARCALWNRGGGAAPFFISGEDLSCQAGVSVQQDLALAALLGLAHVERNGHHYARGMAAAAVPEQRAFVAAHPGLYRTRRGVACLHVAGGGIDLASLDVAGFATAATPRWRSMREMPAGAGSPA